MVFKIKASQRKGKESLNFNAENKILLNTSPKESIERRMKRDSERGKNRNSLENEEDLFYEL